MAGSDAPPPLSPRTGVDATVVHAQGGRWPGETTLAEFATRWIMQVADVSDIGRYAEANDRLLEAPKAARRVVFLGDSITEFWVGLETLAPPGVQFVNRGIAGQGTVQLLLRFQEDVVRLAPDGLVLTAGTNDIRAFVGDVREAGGAALVRIARNLSSMADIARAHGMTVHLGSLPPVCDLPGQPHTAHRDPGRIREMNVWIADYATRIGAGFLDYHAALVDPAGLLSSDCTDDGLHPNGAGYARMAEVLATAGLLDREPG